MTKVAVVLFNLGGPDSLEAVEGFLFNLFYDRYILRVPGFLRYCLAIVISKFRKSYAKKIYASIGGKSPILGMTNLQAKALQEALDNSDSGKQYRVFIFMRHWFPFASSIVTSMCEYGPDQIVVLPLYPHYSITTVLSGFGAWQDAVRATGIAGKATGFVCCYYDHPMFIAAYSDLVFQYYQKAKEVSKKFNSAKPIILFSAHGLPESYSRDGDPYEMQVNRTASLIAENLHLTKLDYALCYQSKVGFAKWLGPSTSDLLKDLSGTPVVVVPISFVSEHSETIYELDIEYARLASDGMYFRVPTVLVHSKFIECLKDIVVNGYNSELCNSHCKMCWKRLKAA